MMMIKAADDDDCSVTINEIMKNLVIVADTDRNL